MISVSLIGCHIDLRQAEIATGGIAITRIAPTGGTHLIVPDGVAVRVNGFSVFGGRRVDGGAGPGPPGAPLVRVRLFSLFGGLKVESRSGHEATRAPSSVDRAPVATRTGAPRAR
jgi:hypothetical protein